jgi:ABC-type antimicrobial peptide transport system permease subunit
MNHSPQPRPPRWARRLLRWYCRPRLLEDLEGDLDEYFDRHLRTKGPARARLIYVLDVLKFCRPYTVRKPEPLPLHTHTIMFSSYLKTSGRSLVRHKLFSFINVIGLGISMSVGLLMIAMLSDLLSYDGFHEKKDRMYRVITRNHPVGQSPVGLASTSVKAGMKIRETMPGVEKITLLRRDFNGDATVGETTLPLSGMWADESFFDVFSFPLLRGNPARALKEPYTLVLTEKSARKLFGSTDVLGKTVRFDTLDYQVTGVVQDVPKLSHLRFEMLASFATVAMQKSDADNDFLAWESFYMNYVYVVLPENGSRAALQANLDKLSDAENAGLTNGKITIALQPLREFTIGERLHNSPGPGIPLVILWVLGGLTGVVILSACFNYTNLSVARSLRRSREVGLRKALGARRGQVLAQFMVESLLIAGLALVFSFLLFLLLRGEFLALHRYLDSLLSLEISPRLIGYFVGFAALVGLAAGFLPASFLARVEAVQVLKNASSLQLFRRVSLRKALVVVQYTFSLIFIATTVIGYNQYRGFLAFDLGFRTANILNIRLQGNKANLLTKELAELPAVTGVSASSIVSSVGTLYGTGMKYKNPRDSALGWQNLVDARYLPLHGHQLLAGKNFTPKPAAAEESEVIVNEQVLKRFGIGGREPAKAIGEVLTADGKKLLIVGVLKDFHYGTLDKKIEPTLFRYSAEPDGYLNVKIDSRDLPATLASIERAWKKIDKVHSLQATFYDDQIEESYSQFSIMLKVIGYLAFLAVCIASMGLFGMVVFTVETRLREMGIRKVLGAGEGNLVYLLSKGFLLLLGVAALVALPATYWFFDQVVLTHFAYHQPIRLGELLLSGTAVVFIALLMIGSQALKAARTNPAEVLKME